MERLCVGKAFISNIGADSGNNDICQNTVSFQLFVVLHSYRRDVHF